MASAEPITLPAPQISPIAPVTDKWAREYEAFCRLLPQLLLSHRGEFVAIHEGKVTAHGQEKLAVALEALRHIGNVAIHVGFVGEAPEPIVHSGVRRALSSAGEHP